MPNNERGADDEQPDAQITRDHRDEKPVAEIGDEIGLPPPGRPGLQAQNQVSTVKTAASASEIGMFFDERFADADEEREQFLAHDLGARCAVWEETCCRALREAFGRRGGAPRYRCGH